MKKGVSQPVNIVLSNQRTSRADKIAANASADADEAERKDTVPASLRAPKRVLKERKVVAPPKKAPASIDFKPRDYKVKDNFAL